MMCTHPLASTAIACVTACVAACATTEPPVVVEPPPRALPACWGSTMTSAGDACLQTSTLRSAIRVDTPPFVAAHFKEENVVTFTIDVDSDGADDFIAEAVDRGITCFFDARGTMRHCASFGVVGPSYDGFAYLWFVQLDDEPPLELLSFEGDSCSGDYTIQQLDSSTWERKRVARFDPILTVGSNDPRHTYWGFPWDISDLAVVDGRAQAAPSCLHEAGETSEPAVALFFLGTPTQGEPFERFTAQLQQRRTMTLDEMIATAAAPCPPRP
jgi:hypothetical protein